MTLCATRLIRRPNGTSWEGHISYNWTAVRRLDHSLEFEKKSLSFLSNIDQIYRDSPSLQVTKGLLEEHRIINSAYFFLYGHSVEELMRTKGGVPGSVLTEYECEPQKWTTAMVESMDWESFCISYYAFLRSTSDFSTKPWKVLKFILHALKKSPNTLASLLSNCGRDSSFSACREFWEAVCECLQAKILNMLCEESCYGAFTAMLDVRSLFSNENFEPFENECYRRLDKIARQRIDAACEETYTVRELSTFDVERLFFYKEYFSASLLTRETKEYVRKRAFDLLYSRGIIVEESKNFIGADAIYEAALSFSNTEQEKALIAGRRNSISSDVETAKKEYDRKQEENERERKKERDRTRRQDKITKNLAKVLLVVFLLSVATIVLFGILFLLNVFVEFSRKILIGALCVMVPFLVFFVIMMIQDKKK